MAYFGLLENFCHPCRQQMGIDNEVHLTNMNNHVLAKILLFYPKPNVSLPVDIKRRNSFNA